MGEFKLTKEQSERAYQLLLDLFADQYNIEIERTPIPSDEENPA